MSPEKAGDEKANPQAQEAQSQASQAASPPHAPHFQNLEEKMEPGGETKGIDFLYDVELDVNVELGRAELKVRDILSLKKGSVVELNRLAGDPVEIIINNRLIARGEVIVIDENFAVRITDILSPSDIVTQLNE